MKKKQNPKKNIPEKKFELSIDKKQDLRVFFFLPTKPEPLRIIPIISHDFETAADFAKKTNKTNLIHVEPSVYVQDLLNMVKLKEAPIVLEPKSKSKPTNTLINMTKMFRDTLVKNKKDKVLLGEILEKVERRIKKNQS